MGNFKQSRDSRGFNRGNSSGGGRFGRGSGSFGGNRGGGGFRKDRDSDRWPREMHDATCSRCGNKCQVPFKPTGSKPVFCSDCFRQNESGNTFGANRGKPERQTQSEEPGKHFNQINAKLDRILKVLEDLEIDYDEEEDDDLKDDVNLDDGEDNEVEIHIENDSEEEDDNDDSDYSEKNSNKE